jgi:hypothetical protein
VADRVMITTDGNQSMVRTGEVAVAATGLRPISDASCDEFIAYNYDLLARSQRITAVLQYSPVQSPTAEQRRRFATLDAKMPFTRVAICTDSMLVRGAVLAIAWLVKTPTETRAFGTSQTDAALRWLAERSPFDMDEARMLLDVVVQNVGLPAVRR